MSVNSSVGRLSAAASGVACAARMLVCRTTSGTTLSDDPTRKRRRSMSHPFSSHAATSFSGHARAHRAGVIIRGVNGGGWLVAVGDWLAMMLPGNRDRGGRERHGVEAEMETVNGATVILPEAGEAAADGEREPVVFGPSQNQEAYVVMVGSMPVGDPAS